MPYLSIKNTLNRTLVSSAKLSVVAVSLMALSLAAQAPIDVRVALVIGNAAYPGTMALKNPANDAVAMSAALKALGFTVIEAKDASRAQMEDAIQKMFGSLKGRQGIGMLYYAGHGLQVDWKNYMVPIDAKMQTAKDVPAQTVDVGDVVDALKAAGSRMNIIVLDACRDNPFAEKGAKGLAPVDAPPGTFMAYATAPGNVAEDGSGENGLYTKHLLAELQKPVSIENVFKRVRFAVRKDSAGRQIPWESTSLEDDFSFAANKSVAKVSMGAQRDADFAEQKAEWDRIKDSKNAADFYTFLIKFPSGLLAEIAQLKLEKVAITAVEVQPPKGEVAQPRLVDKLKVGDEWTTEESDVMGSGFFGSSSSSTHIYKVTEQKGDILSVKRGGLATFFYTPSGAYAGLDQPLVPTVTYDPPIPMMPSGAFQVGYKASSRSSSVRSGSVVGGFDANIHVLAREKITTKMGTFDAYKIEIRANAAGALGGAIETVFTKWFEPNSAIPLREVVEIAATRRRIVKDTVSIKRAS